MTTMTTTTADDTDRYDDDYDDDDEPRNSLTTLHRGVARAISRGLRAYERELTPDNTGRLDSGNGLVEGFISGMSRFYDEMSATSRDVLDDLRVNRRRRRHRHRRDGAVDDERSRAEERYRDDDRASGRIEIDYERLAKLVAEELRKTPGGTTIVTS